MPSLEITAPSELPFQTHQETGFGGSCLRRHRPRAAFFEDAPMSGYRYPIHHCSIKIVKKKFWHLCICTITQCSSCRKSCIAVSVGKQSIPVGALSAQPRMDPVPEALDSIAIVNSDDFDLVNHLDHAGPPSRFGHPDRQIAELAPSRVASTRDGALLLLVPT